MEQSAQPKKRKREVVQGSRRLNDDGSSQTGKRENRIEAIALVLPKRKSIDQLKLEFIKALKVTGGNVSRAVKASGLPRRTAYNHLAADPRFAEEWREAVAIGYDSIDEKLRHEALKENPVPSILIYAHKNIMNQKKWRGRLIHAAKAGVEAMQAKAVELGIPRAQIEEVREAMIKAYEKIPLI